MILIALAPLLALGMVLFNLWTWPRMSRKNGTYLGPLSILIPARNEELRIRQTVLAALQSVYPIKEIIVYDDASQDATLTILEELASEDPRVRILEGGPLPEGWIGKPHACHQLALAAQGEILCFIDADTHLEPNGLEHLAGIMEDLQASVITAVPRQITTTFFERLVIPLLHLTYTVWFPLLLIWRSGDSRFMAANGQLLAIRRRDYVSFGGFASVSTELVDDMAFCRKAKQHGLRVVFADGFQMAQCRMYTSSREVWEGFSKNIYEGLGARVSALGLALGLNIVTFLVPWLTMFISFLIPELLVPSLVGVLTNLTTRFILMLRFAHPISAVLLHPLSIIALLLIALNSWRWKHTGKITWRGRLYSKDHLS